jgi:AmiR/NasT family two-component response regulator
VTPSTSVLVVEVAARRRVEVRRDIERSGQFKVIGEAASAPEAVELSSSLQPDAIVLDVPHADNAGVAILSIRNLCPGSKILALLESPPAGPPAPGSSVAYLDEAAPPTRISLALEHLCGAG